MFDIAGNWKYHDHPKSEKFRRHYRSTIIMERFRPETYKDKLTSEENSSGVSLFWKAKENKEETGKKN